MNKKGKYIVAVLLLLSCIVSGIILAATPAYKTYSIDISTSLDSLIQTQLHHAQVLPEQIRVREIPVDSTFTRKNYTVKVSRRFSKTLFHFDLHKSLQIYDFSTPAEVHFPEEDMDIHIYGYESVLRTIHLITDSELDSLYLGDK